MNKLTTQKNTTYIPAIVQAVSEINKKANNNWLIDYRNSQLKQLAQAQFPTAQTEHFKYNRLNVFDKQSFDQMPNIAEVKKTTAFKEIPELDNNNAVERLVFINGFFSSEMSHVENHGITNFTDTSKAQQDKILKQLNEQTSITHNPFTQINASLIDNGVFIEITEKSPQSTIEIVHVIDNTLDASTVTSHVLIDVADRCKATVITRLLNADGESTNSNLSTHQTLVNVGENAHFTHYVLQLENTNSVSFGNSEYNLQSHSVLKGFYGSTGSIMKKLDITVNHQGQHAHAFLDGLFAATDEQQIDYHTVINHPLPNGQTDEVFRGIVNGRAEATFNGRIHIYEDAQQTRAELSNKNLVLSDEAALHTKPELEIYADDVICAHGATVSRMNDDSLGYLRARAIPKKEAELMLSYGFFNEVLESLEHEAVANYLRPFLFKQFD